MPQLRPTFSRLPMRGYQDNPLADALTSFYDEKLVAVGQQVEGFHLNLDPVTCDAKYLDYIAYLLGMVYPYYDITWAESTKRLIVASANDIFKYRGTLKGLRLAIDPHGFPYKISTATSLTLAFLFTPLPKFGSDAKITYIGLNLLASPRTGTAFKETKRAVDNYCSIIYPPVVCYEHFYIGFSVFGEPFLD